MLTQELIQKQNDFQSTIDAQNVKNSFHPDEFKLTTKNQSSDPWGLGLGTIISNDYFATGPIFKSYAPFVIS